MREFNKVSPALWQSQRFKGLPKDDPRLLFLYLLTNAHQNSAGCYALPEGYARVDLVRWSTKKFHTALAALASAGMIHTDEQTSEVLIDGWFKHNPPMNMKHYIGTMRVVDLIRSPRLKAAASEGLANAWQIFQDRQKPATPSNESSSVLLDALARKGIRAAQ